MRQTPLTFFDSTSITKRDKKKEEKYDNKLLWKNYYNMIAKLDSLKPAAIFNGILSEIKFILPPFLNDNTPLFMVMGDDSYDTCNRELNQYQTPLTPQRIYDDLF